MGCLTNNKHFHFGADPNQDRDTEIFIGILPLRDTGNWVNVTFFVWDQLYLGGGLLSPSASIVDSCSVFLYPKAGFWHSYCQISTDLDKILHTPIVVWNTRVG